MNFFQIINVIILISFHELWMLLMASRIVKTFQKIFNLLCPDPEEKSLSMAAITLQSVFFKE